MENTFIVSCARWVKKYRWHDYTVYRFLVLTMTLVSGWNILNITFDYTPKTEYTITDTILRLCEMTSVVATRGNTRK